MHKEVILINGLARSGKDYLASLLQEHLTNEGKSVEVMHFAEPLKQIIADTFYISLEQLDEYKNASDRFKLNIVDYQSGDHEELSNFRTILQRFGTEGMKPVFGSNIWAKILTDKVEASTANTILIPDFRFDEELECLTESLKDTTSIRTIQVTTKSKGTSEHSSEVPPTNKFDITVDNTLRDKSLNRFAKEYVQTLLDKG